MDVFATSPSQAGKLIDPVGYKTNPPPTDRPIRIFCHGVFDLFHIGHLRFLEIVKNTFPDTYVIAGVTTDEDTTRVKGRTVISAEHRAEMVRGCKYVDEVIANCEPMVTPDFMDQNHIDYFAHADTREVEGIKDPYRFIKEQGKFLVIPRIRDWGSTTEIISRILREQDQLVMRQVKNGVVPRDMNISWLKVFWIRLIQMLFR